MSNPTDIQKFSDLALSLQRAKNEEERRALLLGEENVKKSLREGLLSCISVDSLPLSAQNALFSLVVIGQEGSLLPEDLEGVLEDLIEVDRFFVSLGGIVGYQAKVFACLDKKSSFQSSSFSRPKGIDLSHSWDQVGDRVERGIASLPFFAEVYPIGGLGSRLGLKSVSGDPLPAATLPYCGRSLLEELVRDVQGKEFLYFRLYGKTTTIPIAMMTSHENENHKRIEALCEEKNWFGRKPESFRLFTQPSVPVVSEEGEWLWEKRGKLLLQPGGHGALWKAASEEQVFDWLRGLEKKYLLIRQINNPIGGTGRGLLGFMGTGVGEEKTFGFASCDRLPNAAEGLLVLKQEGEKYSLSNIEYTDMAHYGIEDLPTATGFSPYPTNTNLLFANLSKLLPHIEKAPLPELVLNVKNEVECVGDGGKIRKQKGGRLECMMQNVSDGLAAEHTFLTFNKRRETISVAKRTYLPGNTLLETPEGAFYDQMANSYALLEDHCGVTLPPFSSEKEYLEKGPSTLFLYHPALGPLYEIIEQKIRWGDWKWGSELQLEIADCIVESLSLSGSLLIRAENILGEKRDGVIAYGQETGKCILRGVRVENLGIDRETITTYWKNRIERREALELVLLGRSELLIEGVTFCGSQKIVVPDGERWVVTQNASGEIEIAKEVANSVWTYRKEKRSFILCLGQDKTSLQPA
ncbi:MAG: putative uridylyltransferase [Chlamydiae bacterium]|nr:putative uridylyltransferase [Chlamydiota bacterium]